MVDSAPSLTFKNTDSNAALGTECDVGTWSAADYSDKTRFTSNEALGETGPKVRFYWETTLVWTIKVKDKDGNWVNSLGGTTTWDTVHRSLCVANAQPIEPLASPTFSGSKAWEKVMQFACDFAAGEDTDAAIVDALFNGVDTPDISSKGARLDHEYTFIDRGSPANAQGFVKGKVVSSVRKMRGSCGHFSYFFAQLGHAHGIEVHITDFALVPTAVKDAYNIAVDVPDIDGDWRENTVALSLNPPPNMPGTGNKRWWWNTPAGTASGLQHSVNEYGGHTYDASLGIKGTSEDLAAYMSSGATYYWIRTGSSPITGVWKAKGSVVTDSDKVKWQKITDDSTTSGTTTWPPFP